MFTNRRRRGGYMISIGNLGTINNVKMNTDEYRDMPDVNKDNNRGIILGMKAYNGSMIVDFTNLYADAFTADYLSGYKIYGTIFVETNDGVRQKIEFNLPFESSLSLWESKNYTNFSINNELSIAVTDIELFYCFYQHNYLGNTTLFFGRIYNAQGNATIYNENYWNVNNYYFSRTKYAIYGDTLSRETNPSRKIAYTDHSIYGIDTWNTSADLDITSVACGRNIVYTKASRYPSV